MAKSPGGADTPSSSIHACSICSAVDCCSHCGIERHCLDTAAKHMAEDWGISVVEARHAEPNRMPARKPVRRS